MSFKLIGMFLRMLGRYESTSSNEDAQTTIVTNLKGSDGTS